MSNPQRPNVLFFFTDDQRFDTIGSLNNPRIRTPHIDALLADGVAMQRAYIMGGSTGAVCMPSRAMLHTGRGLWHIQRQGQEIPEEHVTMGQAFRRAGYETFGTGKWHNGSSAYARSFTDGGEIFFGGMDDHWNVPACDFDPTGRYARTPQCESPTTSRALRYRLCNHITAGKHSSELFAEATLDFLRRRDAGKPFFAYLSFMAPHDPRTMPQEFLDLYPPEQIELPANFMPEHPFDNGCLMIRDEKLEAHPRSEEAIRQHIAEYYGMISHLDAQIGLVIDALKTSGDYENTIIILAGDNGLAVGRHGLMGKQNLYDHSIHVPLIFAGPGIAKDQTRDGLCYLVDVFPTLCELTGLDAPSSVEGLSLAGLLSGAAESIRSDLYFAFREIHRAVQDDRYKLIEYVVDGQPRRTQLFDLQADPDELNNLAAQPGQAERVAAMRKRLEAYRDELDDNQPGCGGTFWAGYET